MSNFVNSELEKERKEAEERAYAVYSRNPLPDGTTPRETANSLTTLEGDEAFDVAQRMYEEAKELERAARLRAAHFDAVMSYIKHGEAKPDKVWTCPRCVEVLVGFSEFDPYCDYCGREMMREEIALEEGS